MSDGGRELPRVLGFLSAASILIGAIIGSGIFKKPSAVAAALPSPGWILVCWVTAGGLALAGSLVFAELGSMHPGPGGQYTYLRAAFGRLPAFLFGWTNLLIINAASIAALAVISAEFAFNLLPADARPEAGAHWYRTVPVLLILALTIANGLGVRWGAGIQNLFTVLKLGALALIISALVLPGRTDWSSLSPFWELRGDLEPGAISDGFKAAFLAIFWAYDGWYLLSFSGGEIRDPRRNIPLGFIVGILVVVGVYLAFNLALFGLIDVEQMAAVEGHGGVAGEAALRLFGSVGLTLISAGIVCSTFGAANANILTGPRLSYAMARDGLFFRPFGSVHRRYLTPVIAIAVQGALGAVYVWVGTFDQLTDAVVFAAWIFYLLTVIGYFRLRRRTPEHEHVFRAPGYPLVPLVFVAFAAVFVIYSFTEAFAKTRDFLRDPGNTAAADGVYLIVVVVLILVGLPLFLVVTRGRDPEGRD